jgi:hypothetical protein
MCRLVVLALGLCALLIPTLATGQLREFDITPVQSNRIPVFRDHPEMAAVIVNSSLTNLQFDSNLGIVAILGDANQGEYILIVRPVRQIMTVRGQGFQQGRIPITLNQARQVAYFKVEPRDLVVTARGNLIVRTVPTGATVSIDGIPGEFQTPYTYEGIAAMSHVVRVRLDDYQTEERLVRVESGRANVESFRLNPTFGFLMIREAGLELFLKTPSDPQEYRVSYGPGQPLRRPIGPYSYRLVKPFHQTVSDTFQLDPGGLVELNPTFVPDFAQLRVRANVPAFRLTAVDNRAPEAGSPDAINLEQGLREVTVEAPGYVPRRLMIRSTAGAMIDTTITLITESEASDLARREAMPKGVLQLAADVDAEIFVNGQREGRMQTVLTLIPGTYDVEFRHPLKTERFSVEVPSADLVVRQVHLRPSKSVAMATALVIPGGGHIYTRQWRGAAYLAAMAGVGVFIRQQDTRHGQLSRDYRSAFQDYQNARSIDDAARLKSRAEGFRADANHAADLMMYGLFAAGAVYAVQLADLQFTRPRYGYRSPAAALELGLAPTGVHLTYRLP